MVQDPASLHHKMVSASGAPIWRHGVDMSGEMCRIGMFSPRRNGVVAYVSTDGPFCHKRSDLRTLKWASIDVMICILQRPTTRGLQSPDTTADEDRVSSVVTFCAPTWKTLTHQKRQEVYVLTTEALLDSWRIEPSSLSNWTPARCLYFCSLFPSGPPPIFFSSVRT